MLEMWEVDAREKVRDTLMTYTHSGDRGLLGELADCFVPDGVLEVKDGIVARGREQIIAKLSVKVAAGTPHRFIRHNVSSVKIESVTPDRVEAASYFFVTTAVGPDHWGRYRDVLVPSGERWLIQHRRVTVDAKVAASYLST